MDELSLSHAHWRKSSHSSANGQCVEVAHVDQAVAVRDSKNPDGPELVFTARHGQPSSWPRRTASSANRDRGALRRL